ncbi:MULTISPECIES: hypothetical protein [Streptomyces]|uniref:Uncharacterized protein n=1 Tax=Streptomyces solicathayae TaxID=3081768 RepID=A0ABZ0M483_9ACTN|nr:hypothetical protein [Streptomyces sp. HUAS YS2]WOX25873.1 hypothetical protein R2D22_32630 [Streptomyces sp. HUAS YS2]
MNRIVRKLGDRVLERLAPSATAQADTSFYQFCYCSGPYYYRKLCHVVGGYSTCGSCYRSGEC